MNKSKIRSKILKLRKKNSNKNLKISFNKFFSFLKKNKYNLNNLGGYYPSNFEIDDLEILELLEKKLSGLILKFLLKFFFLRFKILSLVLDLFTKIYWEIFSIFAFSTKLDISSAASSINCSYFF